MVGTHLIQHSLHIFDYRRQQPNCQEFWDNFPNFLFQSGCFIGNYYLLVLKTVNRSRYSSGSSYKCVAGEIIYRHDRCIAKQSTKLYHLTYTFSDNRNQTNCRCLLVNHTDCHLVSNNTRNGSCFCVTRNGNHIKTYGADTGHSFQFFQRKCSRLYGINHSLIFTDRNKCTA